MNFAGLVRLSFELPDSRVPAGGGSAAPLTGRDIRGRDEQAKDCRSYVGHRHGSYIYTYEEPDTSAFKRKAVRLPDGRRVYRVVRPVFEGALEDLKRGKAPNGERLDGLVVYDIDRLTRDNRHLEDAIEVVEHFRRPIVDITGTLDLLTDNGRTVARIVVAANNKQSADTARRVARKHRALQQAGIPAGGWRPFGWKAGKRELEPAEAEAIRAAARRVIGGAPLNAVVAEWNRLGRRLPMDVRRRRRAVVAASMFMVRGRMPRCRSWCCGSTSWRLHGEMLRPSLCRGLMRMRWLGCGCRSRSRLLRGAGGCCRVLGISRCWLSWSWRSSVCWVSGGGGWLGSMVRLRVRLIFGLGGGRRR
ncbi:recombinase family protein [Dactylosporangium sp. NPDC049140]|uniref:recombinase family protein n=1 Tax=Dactylosporangium sp. NPDC049140 TaxID=3155647 RepID=UPI0033F4E398